LPRGNGKMTSTYLGATFNIKLISGN